MSLFRSFRAAREQRGAREDFLSFKDLVWQGTTHAGVRVTQANAFTLPAVYRCWALNTETVASLPVDAMIKLRTGKRQGYPTPWWLRRPNPEQDWGEFLSQVQLSLEMDGNAFILKVSDGRDELIAMNVMAPGAVEVDRTAEGRIIYKVQRADRTIEVLPDTAVLHIKALTLPGAIRGMSPITALQQTIGLGMAAEQFGAQFFGTGATLSGIIEMTSTPSQEAIDRLKEGFQRKHGGISNSHAIGILTGGATFRPLSVKPEESQFLETRKLTAVEIAHVYGVPEEYVANVEGAKGYVTGIYARQYMWLQAGINPRLWRLERAFSALLPGGAYIKFNRNAFLAMDPGERSQFYAAGLRDRWLVPNEVREKEDMDPLPGGDEALWSVQWQEVSNKTSD